MQKFDLNDVVLIDLLRRDAWMSTSQLLQRLEKAGKADPVRRTLIRRLNLIRDELGWIESRKMPGNRKAFEWRRTNAVDKIKVSDGPWQALALKLLKRFSDKKMPPVVVHSLEPFFCSGRRCAEKIRESCAVCIPICRLGTKNRNRDRRFPSFRAANSTTRLRRRRRSIVR
jgi:hypothetical protein